MKRLLVCLLLALPACADETLVKYGGAGKWRVTELNGQSYAARAVLVLEAGGKLYGQAACNRFFGQQTAPYPWFETGPIGTTRMACPELDQEQMFLNALSRANQAEVSGDTLVLSNGDDVEIVLIRVPE